jgi:hypothetical protein
MVQLDAATPRGISRPGFHWSAGELLRRVVLAGTPGKVAGDGGLECGGSGDNHDRNYELCSSRWTLKETTAMYASMCRDRQQLYHRGTSKCRLPVSVRASSLDAEEQGVSSCAGEFRIGCDWETDRMHKRPPRRTRLNGRPMKGLMIS